MNDPRYQAAALQQPAAMSTQDQPQPQQMTAVSMTPRIPDFWQDRPRLWFHQFNAIVDPLKASDLHKSQLLIARLKPDELPDISDILENMPENNKYETLRNRLISVYEESETKQMNQLLNEIELGDQKPSQLLRRMRDLGKNKVPDDTLKLLWTGRLPHSIRAVLTACDTGEVKLDGLAKIADKILENTRPSEIAPVSKTTPSADPTLPETIVNELKQMKLEISELRTKLNDPNNHQNRESRSRDRYSRGTSRTRSKSRETIHKNRENYLSQKAKPGDANYKCFYHFTYGTNARKCGDTINCNKMNPEN